MNISGSLSPSIKVGTSAYTYGYSPLTGYTGHVQTDPTGLIYMRGRFYSPAWHVFVNSDQGVDPLSWNQRAYVGGNPFMATDPSGMRNSQPGARNSWAADWSRIFGFWLSDSYGINSAVVEVTDASPFPDYFDVGYSPPSGWGYTDPLLEAGGVGGVAPVNQQTPPKPNPCDDPIVGSKKAIDDARALFRLQGNGFNKTERSMWAIFDSAGNYSSSVVWPWSAATARETWRGPLPFGPGEGANIHVHPNGYDPAPSRSGGNTGQGDYGSMMGMTKDFGFNVPFYTISRSGIWRLDNVTEQSQKLVDGSWLKRYPCP